MGNGKLSSYAPPASHIDPCEIRLRIFEAVSKSSIANTDLIIKQCKEVEAYVWYKMAPIEKAPTPLSTIEEAATATYEHLSDLIDNCGDEEKKIKLQFSRHTWQRFISEIHEALQNNPR